MATNTLKSLHRSATVHLAVDFERLTTLGVEVLTRGPQTSYTPVSLASNCAGHSNDIRLWSIRS